MDTQLMIETEEKKIKACAFTGHRALSEDFSEKQLKKQIEILIQNGVEIFYNGGAIGFDLISAKITLAYKKKYPHIKLIVCVPYYGQERYYTQEEKKEYGEICKKADEVYVLSEHYYKGCNLARDRYMADRADVLIAYLKKTAGGTAYTVSYFQKKYKNKEIIYI